MSDKPIFKDNATSKIIAFDFDNTLCVGDHFPNIGAPRKYAKQVTNKLHELGVKVVIWTCRDIDRVMDMADDIKPMERWLITNDIHYDSVNSAIEFAPFHYEARKIYAHMYVDDRGFGWYEYDDILLEVFMKFCGQHLNICGNGILKMVDDMKEEYNNERHIN